MGRIPETILIAYDDYHAKHIGRLASGQQFFLTTPFVPATPDATGGEYVALFTFDDSGALLRADIDSLGPRADLDRQRAADAYESRLESLDGPIFGDIRVAPFRIEHEGVEFGLIASDPDDPAQTPWVTLEPGNYMAFSPPWDGEYDT